MSDYTFSEKVKTSVIKTLIKMLDSDPERNIPRIVELLQKFDRKGTIKNQLNEIKKAMDEKSNWYQLAGIVLMTALPCNPQ